MSTAATAPAADTGAPTTETSPNDVPDNFDMTKFASEVDNGKAADVARTEIEGKPKAEPADKATKAKAPEVKKTTTDAPDKTAKQPGEEGNETAYQKAQKEKTRQESVLRNFQQEKEAFRAEKQAIAAQMEALKREVQQLKAGPAKDEHGLTADTYERLADKYSAEGNEEMAKAARARADKLHRQAPAAEPSKQTDANAEPWKTPEFQAQWKEQTAALLAEDATLNDPANPVVKAANTLLEDKTWAPFFRARPDGIRAAVEVGKLLEKSAQIDAAREELKTAKAEIERLTKLTQPRGSHPSAPPNTGPKDVNEMTAEDVMAAARAADTGG